MRNYILDDLRWISGDIVVYRFASEEGARKVLSVMRNEDGSFRDDWVNETNGDSNPVLARSDEVWNLLTDKGQDVVDKELKTISDEQAELWSHYSPAELLDAFEAADVDYMVDDKYVLLDGDEEDEED